MNINFLFVEETEEVMKKLFGRMKKEKRSYNANTHNKQPQKKSNNNNDNNSSSNKVSQRFSNELFSVNVHTCVWVSFFLFISLSLLVRARVCVCVTQASLPLFLLCIISISVGSMKPIQMNHQELFTGIERMYWHETWHFSLSQIVLFFEIIVWSGTSYTNFLYKRTKKRDCTHCLLMMMMLMN